MIRIENLTFGFEPALPPLFENVNVQLRAGEIALVAGVTGSGKSSFLKSLCGLIPNFSGGVLSGSISIDGTEILGTRSSNLATLIGYVSQQAESSFVADTVAEEIAFVLEQHGFSREEMSARVSWAATAVGLAHMLERPCRELSGGEQQRLAIAAAIAGGAQVLLLDEPTSELDPNGAGQIVQLLSDLAKQRGITVIVAEHKFDRLLSVVDAVLIVADQRIKQLDTPAALGELVGVESPMFALSRKAGWHPHPVSIAKAKQLWATNPGQLRVRQVGKGQIAPTQLPVTPLLSCVNFEVKVGKTAVASVPRLEVNPGETVAVIGPNGAGKSSFFWGLVGELPTSGDIRNLASIALVPQAASDLLLLQTVGHELQVADKSAAKPAGTTEGILESLVGKLDPSLHPRDISAGQQLGVALAIQLVRDENLIILDEPTRGLDYRAKQNLVMLLKRLNSQGIGLLVASHDMDFVAEVADKCIQLHAGKVVAAGRPEVILTSLGEQAPTAWQITRQVLSVSEVV